MTRQPKATGHGADDQGMTQTVRRLYAACIAYTIGCAALAVALSYALTP